MRTNHKQEQRREDDEAAAEQSKGGPDARRPALRSQGEVGTRGIKAPVPRLPKGGMSPVADRKEKAAWAASLTPARTGFSVGKPGGKEDASIIPTEPVGGWVDKSTGRRMISSPTTDPEKLSIRLLSKRAAASPERSAGKALADEDDDSGTSL